jgi:hypothetical protein
MKCLRKVWHYVTPEVHFVFGWVALLAVSKIIINLWY